VLFVPADRPDRIRMAGSRGSDAVVIDLEDAVAPGSKERARSAAAAELGRGLHGPVMVRVNAVDCGELEPDIAELGSVWPRVDAVLLPKAAGAADVIELDRLLTKTVGETGPAVIPIVETAAGVFEARALASATSRVVTLLFGPADLSAELGVEPTPEGRELVHARSQVVLATAAAGIEAPLDGPHLILGDADGLARAARSARELGFGGKAVIHPEQIPVVHAEFAPRPAEVAWAERVITAAAAAGSRGAGVVRLADGTFVDEPILRRARAILGVEEVSASLATGADR
jgi:citrate lyase subunit beta/citryl-CoA lyase